MMDFTRAGSDGGERREPPPLHTLTTKQRALVEAVDAYERATGEPCTSHYLARRFRVDPTTIRSHFFALYRKGWLRAPNSPASLRRKISNS
jgi:transcriptional regulator GlxA family with amidase domain